MALRTPLSVTPHLYMGDSTGRPLDKGVVYFGEQDKDPEFYPINLFSDDALTLPLAQPVHTKGGYLYDKGDMVEPHAKEIIYSVKVLDSYGRKVFYKGAMMRNSWNDDVIEQINQAVIGSADAARQVATDITNEAINNTAVEGGVLADTFVTVTANGVGAVARTQRDVNSDTLNAKDFGAKGDAIADDYTALQLAINVAAALKRTLTITDGIYKVSESLVVPQNSNIIGAGSDKVKIITTSMAGLPVMATPTIPEIPLTLTSDLIEGSKSNDISNECNEGDFIRYKSNELFTRRWTSDVVRDTYYEAEMLMVESATTDNVVFNRPSFIRCLVGKSPEVVYFTPSENITIKGICFAKERGAANTAAEGLLINQAKYVTLDDITTENFEAGGVRVNKSMFVTTGITKHVGGIGSGLSYGTSYTDGSKDCVHNESIGDHAQPVNGGGSGWAIPAYITIKSCRSVAGYRTTFDTHGNSAYFTFSNVFGKRGGGLGGFGHTLKDVVINASLADVEDGSILETGLHHTDGGCDLHYENITLNNITKFGFGRIVAINSTFKNIKIVSDKLNSLTFAAGSKNNIFDNFKLINPASSNAVSTVVADSYFTADTAKGFGALLGEGCTASNIYVEGYPIGLFAAHKNCSITDVILKNCGWKTTKLSPATIYATDIESTIIERVSVKNTNVNLDFKTTFLRFIPNAVIFEPKFKSINNFATPFECRPSTMYTANANYRKAMFFDVNIWASSSAVTLPPGATATYFNTTLSP